jgi:hypothetical protein
MARLGCAAALRIACLGQRGLPRELETWPHRNERTVRTPGLLFFVACALVLASSALVQTAMTGPAACR